MRARTALIVAAAIVCLVLSGCATFRQDEASVVVPTPVATISTHGARTPSPTATDVWADAVPAAPPTRLVFPAAGIDGPVEEYTATDAAAEGGIDPETLDTIAWYSGVPDPEPGTDARNTVYIFGHAWIEPAVFNDLVDVEAGDEATLTTANGELVYAVDEVVHMAKSDFTQDARVTAVVPGRLALVTCYRPDGWDPSAHAPDNTVVFLHLVGARSD